MGQGGATQELKFSVPGILPPEQIPTRWRDILEVDIRDTALKIRVEGFLDYLEKTKFSFGTENAATGRLGTGQISGQDILGNIAALKSRYDRDGISAELKNRRDPNSTGGVYMPNGKFAIRQNDRLFNVSDRTTYPLTALTATKNNPDGAPAIIRIPPDYLKGAQFRGTDGRLYPASVDETVMHELVHLAYQSKAEDTPMALTRILAMGMGVPPLSSGQIEFRRNSNVTAANPTGYTTLYDKPAARPRARIDELRENRDEIAPQLAQAALGNIPAVRPEPVPPSKSPAGM